MGTTSWANIRAEAARSHGYRSFTTTSGHVAPNAIHSTGLIPFAPGNDVFNGWYVLVEAGTNVGAERRVLDYLNTGRLDTSNPVLTDDDNARACSLYRYFAPSEYLTAFNQATKEINPTISIVRDIKTIVTGFGQRVVTLPSTVRDIDALYMGNRIRAESSVVNVALNSGFEDWTSGAPDNWTLSGSGSTVAQEEDTTDPPNYVVLEGNSSAKISVALNTATTLLQTITPSVGTEGTEANHTIWVYCNTASRVSAQISGTDVVSSPVTGTAHGGTGWEQLSVTANLDNDATSFDFGISITSGAAIALYVDESICAVGQPEIDEGVWEPLDWSRFIPPVNGASSGVLELNTPIDSHTRLRILGHDILSTVSADTDTVEVDGEYLQILVNKTNQILAENKVGEARDEPQKILWLREVSRFRNRVDEALDEGVGAQLNMRKRWHIPDEQ